MRLVVVAKTIVAERENRWAIPSYYATLSLKFLATYLGPEVIVPGFNEARIEHRSSITAAAATNSQRPPSGRCHLRGSRYALSGCFQLASALEAPNEDALQ